MPTATVRHPKRTSAPVPEPLPVESVRHFTLAQYNRLIDLGILGKRDRCHLINGVVRNKMPENAPYLSATAKLNRRLTRMLPEEYFVLADKPVQFPNTASEPEPDFTVTHGPDTRFDESKPVAADVLLLVEVSDSTLASDRGEMLRIYAGGKVPVYWIVNIPEGTVEVYTDPRGGRNPTYRARTDFSVGQSVPIILGGQAVGKIAVADILPGGN